MTRGGTETETSVEEYLFFLRIGGNMITCVCKAEVIPGEETEIYKKNEEEKSFLLIGKIIL